MKRISEGVVPLFLVASLLCLAADTRAAEEDMVEMYISYTAFHIAVRPDFSIYVLRVDLNEDGGDEYLIRDDERAIGAAPNDTIVGFMLFRKKTTGVGYAMTTIEWDVENPAVAVPRLGSIDLPVVVAPQGSWERLLMEERTVRVWRYKLYVFQKNGIIDSARSLEGLYPQKSREELDALFQDLAKTGKRLDDFKVYRVRDLAKKYNILTEKDPRADFIGKGDPGFRMIGPNLPADGVELTTQEVRMLYGTRDITLLPRFQHLATTRTLTSAFATTATAAGAFRTSHTLKAPVPKPITAATPEPSPEPPPPAPVSEAPALHGSPHYSLQAFFVCVAALVVLGGAFAYSRRRR